MVVLLLISNFPAELFIYMTVVVWPSSKNKASGTVVFYFPVRRPSTTTSGTRERRCPLHIHLTDL